jgi:hypothetical protein
MLPARNALVRVLVPRKGISIEEGDRMTPLTEWKDLLSRSRALFSAVLLVFITFALLAVAAAMLFFSVFITTFRTGRVIVEQMTARVAVPELLR